MEIFFRNFFNFGFDLVIGKSQAVYVLELTWHEVRDNDEVAGMVPNTDPSAFDVPSAIASCIGLIT